MTTEVATTQQKAPARWKALLDQAMPSIAESLPAHVTKQKFRQVAASAIGSTPMLRECLESNPAAVLSALGQCAADGLLPDGRKAALVPFRDNKRNRLDLTYIPMIAGVLQRMRQSGEVLSITSRVVHKNDTFEIDYGDEDRISHKPCMDGEPGPRIGAYAIIKLKGGETYREFMTAKQIKAVKDASRAKNGPWTGPFEDEMWRKTVLKRAAKYCPFSDDLVSLLDRDNSFYDPDKTIDAAPAPDIRERFAAATGSQTLTDERYNFPGDDEGENENGAPDASDGPGEAIEDVSLDETDDEHQNDTGDVSSQAEAGVQGEAAAPDPSASPAPSSEIRPAIEAIALKIRKSASVKAATMLFEDFFASDLGGECSEEEFAHVEAAKTWRVAQGAKT